MIVKRIIIIINIIIIEIKFSIIILFKILNFLIGNQIYYLYINKILIISSVKSYIKK